MSDHPRSYLRRQGQATRAQKQAIREHWPRFGLTYKYHEQLDLEQAFGRSGTTVLEIGFGMGECLIARAKANPTWNLLGIEMHRPGLGAALQGVERQSLTNVRVLRGDGLTVLADHLGDHVLDEVCIFFPDPWPRDKDSKRRIVRPWLAELLLLRLRPGGVLHLATDVEAYADHMLGVMSEAPGWLNQAGEGQFCARPSWRPVTRYEARGLKEGRQVHNLCFSTVC